MILLSIITQLFLTLHAHAQLSVQDAAAEAKWAGSLTMNGYALDSYKNFAQDWSLVTVRYRQDSGEFRFVYANDLAYKALQAGGKNYPDGSVFAKTAYLLGTDKAFPSSLVPEKTARYQLMVKDKKKHKQTDGWGYALFDPTGKTFAGDPAHVTQSCHACHTIVRKTDFVFSELIQKEIQFLPSASKAKNRTTELPKFKDIDVKTLPVFVIDNLPTNTTKLRSVTGELVRFTFDGTLNEIKPFLAIESLRSGLPAILLSQDKKRFSMVFQDKEATSSCETVGGSGVPMISIVSVAHQPESGLIPYASLGKIKDGIAVQSFCGMKDSR